jgi:uncharacterized protein GlcG (DUF336 family)
MRQVRHLDLTDARRLADAAIAESQAVGVPMAFAVLDAAGHPVFITRMDGAGWLTADIARAKAYAAAGWGAETGGLQDRLQSAAPFLVTALAVQTGGKFMPQRGGVPVRLDGQIVGALGASGGTAAQDEQVVRAAITATFGPEAI